MIFGEKCGGCIQHSFQMENLAAACVQSVIDCNFSKRQYSQHHISPILVPILWTPSESLAPAPDVQQNYKK